LRRSFRITTLTATLTLLVAAPAHASVAHTVTRGETLWSIAAANNLATSALAAANGLSENANVVLGQTIWIPGEGEAASALGGGAGMAGGSTTAAAPQPMGAYTVQPGDTLSGIAARSGVSVSQLAWMNGLDPSGYLLSGTPLKLPSGAAPTSAPASAPASAAVPDAAPHPTPEFVSPSQIGAIASAYGVSPSLATAIARQESGFNNNLVSSANARGVMQILPGTWDWIQSNLARSPLNAYSAQENVHAGVMYLGQLLRDTGGDPTAAAAAYYQGLGSVRRSGLFPATQRYVADVMALRRQYGGP
jgi:N-acetylmuramoyl-L-alanine amidase